MPEVQFFNLKFLKFFGALLKITEREFFVNFELQTLQNFDFQTKNFEDLGLGPTINVFRIDSSMPGFLVYFSVFQALENYWLDNFNTKSGRFSN